jgi:hypothetical protein
MPQLPIAEHVEEIIKLDLAARMKKANFRKRKNGFWRETTTKGNPPLKAVLAIDVQIGANPASYEGVVAPRVGVFFPDLMPIMTPWQKKAPSPLTAQECHVKAQVGLLGPWKNAEHSWRVDSATDDGALAKEIADAIETHGLPYLEAALDLAKIAAGEVPGADPYLVALALQRLGKKDAARAKVDEILAANPTRYMEVASFAGRLKLTIPPRPTK